MTRLGLRQKVRQEKLLLPMGVIGFVASVLQIVQVVVERRVSVILPSLAVICSAIVAAGFVARRNEIKTGRGAGRTRSARITTSVKWRDSIAYFSLGLAIASVIAMVAAFVVGPHLPTPSPSQPPLGLKLFELPSSNSHPVEITAGPDGNMWFTEQDTDKIGRITLGGNVSEFGVPTINGYPFAITAGPDGNIWFTEGKPDNKSGNRIGRITPAGEVREFPVPTDGANPVSITAGPDGNLWFTEYNSDKIGRISTDGRITEFPIPTHPMDFPIPTGHSHPDQITVGPDGDLWFTEFFGNRIGRMTTDGTLAVEFPVPTPGAHPVDIVSGPDGNLWFTEFDGNRIGRISTRGQFTEDDVPTADARPANIVVGPDNQMWFTELQGNKIARIGTDGRVREYPVSADNGQPLDIAKGDNNTLWFTMSAGNNIGRVTIR